MLALLAVLALLLAGCGSSRDALDLVLEAGVLRVGMDASYPPFEYVDGEGNLVGFDVELARELAARLGPLIEAEGRDDSTREVQAQFVANLSYDGLYDALTAGQVDVVISALYVDPTRMADFSYSTVYFDAGQVLVVAQGTSGITGMEDLAGRRLAVEFGSEGDMVARTWARRLVGLTVLSCGSADEALGRVATGEADAALVDHLSALTREDLRVVGAPVTAEPYAVAVRRESRGLLRLINRALADMQADGTLAALERRWFYPQP